MSSVSVASEWPPNWIDADGLLLREYADCPRTHIEGKTLRCCVENSSKFILWFVPAFGALFCYLVYPTIEIDRFRVLFAVMAPLALISVFAITYGISRYHESLGDYLSIDLSRRLLVLPRYGKSFSLDSIICFQFISGYRRPFRVNLRLKWSRELNVLVDIEGRPVRFHLIGNPRKTIVREIVDFSGVPLATTTCPSGFFLCSDANGDG